MTVEQPKRSITASRDEHRAQVRDKPTQRLAAQCGISGHGLAKICRLLGAPFPTHGHWLRKATGHTVKQIPVPAKTDAMPL